MRYSFGMSRALVLEAVRNGPAVSGKALLDRLFAYWFGRFVYNQIWEDPRVDLAAMQLTPACRIVAIASGGCNLAAYLTGDPAEVIGLDVNPAHVALTRLKLAAIAHLPDHAALLRFFGHADEPGNRALYARYIEPELDETTRAFWHARTWTGRRRVDWFATGFYRHALLGRFLGLLHRLGALAGCDTAELLAARTLAEQRAAFERVIAPLFDLPLIGQLARLPVLSYSLGIPAAQFDKMRREGGDIVAVYRDRVRRLACDFPLADNCFAWQAFGRRYDPAGRAVPDYLRAEHYRAIRAGIGRVDVRNAAMTAYLAAQPSESVDRYVLLDAQDWMDAGQLTALWQQIGRTARPGARVIFRTAAEPSPLETALPPELLAPWRAERAQAQALHAQDRSAIYGGFHLYARRDA
jgi:S-adenosylmethionine-diacylglycerol 3-amino-3-carboxypropyl transferase